MTNIKERVLQIAVYKGVTKERFFKELGLSYANFKGIQKKSALNSDAIDIILSIHDDISVEWLVIGKGEMLKRDISKEINKKDAYILSLQAQINDLYDKYTEVDCFMQAIRLKVEIEEEI